MKLYSSKLKRNIERQIHFGVGKSVRTACGMTLFSRHVLVSVFSDYDGAIITDDLNRVTCKRCLATEETRLRKIIALEREVPGIFDRPSLASEDWLLEHGLKVSSATVEEQKMKVSAGDKTVTLSLGMRSKDRRAVLRSMNGK